MRDLRARLCSWWSALARRRGWSPLDALQPGREPMARLRLLLKQ